MELNKFERNVIIGTVISILIICVIGFLQVKVEQDTFNRFSDAKVTYLEAMFTNLRVVPDKCK